MFMRKLRYNLKGMTIELFINILIALVFIVGVIYTTILFYFNRHSYDSKYKVVSLNDGYIYFGSNNKLEAQKKVCELSTLYPQDIIDIKNI